jgi:hypothetical protein
MRTHVGVRGSQQERSMTLIRPRVASGAVGDPRALRDRARNARRGPY